MPAEPTSMADLKVRLSDAAAHPYSTRPGHRLLLTHLGVRLWFTREGELAPAGRRGSLPARRGDGRSQGCIDRGRPRSKRAVSWGPPNWLTS